MLSPDELDRLSVVLVNARNPLNIGAAARAMGNLGFTHLRVVNPFPLPFREARSAVNASAILKSAKEFPKVADAVADCSLIIGTTAAVHRDPQHSIKHLEAGARLIRKKLSSGGVAILFGSEKTGLSQEDLTYCHWLMRIPTREAHASMNLGQAVAVCLYELVRDSETEHVAEKSKETIAANAKDLERITSLLMEALTRSGYIKSEDASATAQLKLRRMVRRLNISEADALTFLGMLRKIQWKLNVK